MALRAAGLCWRPLRKQQQNIYDFFCCCLNLSSSSYETTPTSKQTLRCLFFSYVAYASTYLKRNPTRNHNKSYLFSEQNERERNGHQVGWQKWGEVPRKCRYTFQALTSPRATESDHQRTVCSGVFIYKYIKCCCFPWVRHLKGWRVRDNIALPEFTSDCWFLGNTTMKARLCTKIFNFQIQISILFTLRNGTIISLWSAV